MFFFPFEPLLNSCYVPGIVLGVGKLNEWDPVLIFKEFMGPGRIKSGRQTKELQVTALVSPPHNAGHCCQWIPFPLGPQILYRHINCTHKKMVYEYQETRNLADMWQGSARPDQCPTAGLPHVSDIAYLKEATVIHWHIAYDSYFAVAELRVNTQHVAYTARNIYYLIVYWKGLPNQATGQNCLGLKM